MAQRIWLIRHGKSSRPVGVVDHQRPLAKRASGDGDLIGEWLGSGPRLFVASSARRAQETAALIAGDRPVRTDERLYDGSETEFLEVVEETLASAEAVAFVGHNPTITNLVNRLAGRVVTDNVPTFGVALFEHAGGKSRTARWQFLDYAAPKLLRQPR